MFWKFLFVCLLAAIGVSTACSPAESYNTANNQNTNATMNIAPQDLPPGFSASPAPPSTNTTPGIPAPSEVNKVPRGATPTPGIPDPKTLNRPVKPGLTPTPGIPDPATLRRQMNRPATDINKPPPANMNTNIRMNSMRNTMRRSVNNQPANRQP